VLETTVELAPSRKVPLGGLRIGFSVDLRGLGIHIQVVGNPEWVRVRAVFQQRMQKERWPRCDHIRSGNHLLIVGGEVGLT
jgi:hypothetical protein